MNVVRFLEVLFLTPVVVAAFMMLLGNTLDALADWAERR